MRSTQQFSTRTASEQGHFVGFDINRRIAVRGKNAAGLRRCGACQTARITQQQIAVRARGSFAGPRLFWVNPAAYGQKYRQPALRNLQARCLKRALRRNAGTSFAFAPFRLTCHRGSLSVPEQGHYRRDR